MRGAGGGGGPLATQLHRADGQITHVLTAMAAEGRPFDGMEKQGSWPSAHILALFSTKHHQVWHSTDVGSCAPQGALSVFIPDVEGEPHHPTEADR